MVESKLTDVFEKAAKDPAFFESLMDDSDAALSRNGFVLSAEDNVSLRELLRGPIVVDTEALFGTIHDLLQPSSVPWAPPPWKPKEPAQ